MIRRSIYRESKEISEMDWNNIQNKLANDKRAYARKLATKVDDYINSSEYEDIYGTNLNLVPLTPTELVDTIKKIQETQGENLDLTSIDVSNIKGNLSFLFSKNDFAPIVTLNVSGWKLHNASSVEGLFSEIKDLKSINVTGVEFGQDSLARLFRCNNNLEEIIGLETWHVSNVVNFMEMFVECYKLKSIDTRLWCARPTLMNSMFCACRSLTDINLENMTLCNVKYTYYFAEDCPELRIVEFPQRGIKKFKQLINIESMFSGCVKLQTIVGIEDCDMQNVIKANELFLNCKRLKLDISNWKFADKCKTKSMLKGAKNVMCDWEDAENLTESRKRFSSKCRISDNTKSNSLYRESYESNSNEIVNDDYKKPFSEFIRKVATIAATARFGFDNWGPNEMVLDMNYVFKKWPTMQQVRMKDCMEGRLVVMMPRITSFDYKVRKDGDKLIISYFRNGKPQGTAWFDGEFYEFV